MTEMVCISKNSSRDIDIRYNKDDKNYKGVFVKMPCMQQNILNKSLEQEYGFFK